MKPRLATRRIIFHHTGGPRSQSPAAIARYHTEVRGYEAVAYHYLVTPTGTVVPGRDIHLQGAHDAGENADSVGICLIGDNTTPGEEWTPAQLASAQQLIDALRWVYGPIPIAGHRDNEPPGTPTLCPGIDTLTVLH